MINDSLTSKFKQFFLRQKRSSPVFLFVMAGLILSLNGNFNSSFAQELSDEQIKAAIESGRLDPDRIELLKQKLEQDKKKEGGKPGIKQQGDTEIQEVEKLDGQEKDSGLSPLENMFMGKIPLSISRGIEQFGYSVFGTASTSFAPVGNVPVGPDYIIGTEDNLIVYIWGKVVQETFSVTVDRDGKINLPKAGNLYVWGLKFSEVEKLIKKTMEEYYANLQISVTMGRLRTIKVFVLGDVQKPGAYTISSLSTVFHAVYEAGGPSKLGSMRSVKLIRDNKEVDTIDLYKFLLAGDKSQDHKLQSNDTIFVPAIGPVAGIAGNVKRPAIYEISGNLKISDFIQMGGGLTPIGYLQRVQLERIKDRERRIVIDLKLKNLDELQDSDQDIQVQDGDLILIFPILPQKYNYVSITGNVLSPGDYEYIQDMRVKDLIAKAGGIVEGTYLERAEINRNRIDRYWERSENDRNRNDLYLKEAGSDMNRNARGEIDRNRYGRAKEVIPFNLGLLLDGKEEENFLLQEWDELIVYSKADVLPMRFVQINGAVYKPGEYELSPNMKLNDLIFKAGNLKPTASLDNAELFRVNAGEHSQILRISLADLDSNNSEAANLLLQENDHLYIRQTSEYAQKKIITITGQVKFPGQYAAEKDERLSSIIQRAGGFTDEAFLKGAMFTRESIKEVQKRMMLSSIELEKKALLREETTLERSNISEAEVKEKELTFQRRRELLDKLSSMEVLGRMIISISELDKIIGSKNDILIEDGDALFIPQIPSSVHVLGSVYNPSSMIYEPGKMAGFYLDKVGGITKYADKNGIYIIKADGQVTKEFARIQEVEKGDTIVVPEEFRTRTRWQKAWLDTTQIMYNLAVGAAVVMK